MLGYLDNPEANASTFTADGWIRTGDIGLIDKHGNLRITDRLKDLIKVRFRPRSAQLVSLTQRTQVKGFQVTPAELEGVLNASPLIADAGVCGIADLANASEKPRGWIVLTEAGKQLDRVRLADEVRKYTEARLTHYKRLTGNLRIIDVVPKSGPGKILCALCWISSAPELTQAP
jgi:acyl-CoA synthetase (AMP-forming)/AMP-acid ligase II